AQAEEHGPYRRDRDARRALLEAREDAFARRLDDADAILRRLPELPGRFRREAVDGHRGAVLLEAHGERRQRAAGGRDGDLELAGLPDQGRTSDLDGGTRRAAGVDPDDGGADT